MAFGSRRTISAPIGLRRRGSPRRVDARFGADVVRSEKIFQEARLGARRHRQRKDERRGDSRHTARRPAPVRGAFGRPIFCV
jgi:hypothetical protein